MLFFCTFGCGQVNGGYVLPILADSEASARAYMFDTYGDHWCTSYTEENWISCERKNPALCEKRMTTKPLDVTQVYIQGSHLGKYSFWGTPELRYLLRDTSEDVQARDTGCVEISPETYFYLKAKGGV